MKILSLVSHNFWNKSCTRRPEDAVPFPDGFRGELVHDVDTCISCSNCVYVCSPGAIKISQEEPEQVEWKYTEDCCTFCGFCVDYCPTNALSFSAVSPEAITQRDQHYIDHKIELQPCRSCGKPVQLIPQNMLEKLYGKPLPPEVLETQGLCERCRQELISTRFLKTLVVKGDRKNV